MKLLFENWRKYLYEQDEIQSESPQVHPEAIIYCDMDGVLVDFESDVIDLVNSLLSGGDLPGGTKKSKGYSKRINKLQRELGMEWRASNKEDLNIKVVKNFMMGVVGADPGIVFSDLSPLEDGVGSLWPFLNSTGHTVNILSAAVRAREGATMTSEEGKTKWLARLEPKPTSIIVVQAGQGVTSAEKKAVYAKTNGIQNILIDDSEKNTKAWRDAGGLAIDHIPRGSEATIQTLEELFNETPI